MSRKSSENYILAMAMAESGELNNREAGDDRFPLSQLTCEQYKSIAAVMEKCNDKTPETTSIPKKEGLRFSGSQYHEAYQAIENLVETGAVANYKKENCVLCGEKMPDNRQLILCADCAKKMNRGILSGLSHVRGLKNITKRCPICGRPANPNMRGYCSTCYNRGGAVKDFSADTLLKRYVEVQRGPKKQYPDETVSQDSNDVFKRKQWKRIKPTKK